jgi:hypothetical protein
VAVPRKRWQPFEPVVVLVDEMEKIEGVRTYAASIYSWPFDPDLIDDEETWYEFFDDRDEHHISRGAYEGSPEDALQAGIDEATDLSYKILKAESLY